MSTTGISSSLLSQISSSSLTSNEFVSDLNQLAKDLQSGNLNSAQQDFVTLSNDALNGVTSSTASSSTSGITTNQLSGVASSGTERSSFVNELNQLGTDLQNGDLPSAQSDMLVLQTVAAGGASTDDLTSQSNRSESAELIEATVQAIESGDNSVASSALSQLASDSPSSAGAKVLEQESQSFASGSVASSTSGSLSQLLQGLNSTSSSNSSSLLSLLA